MAQANAILDLNSPDWPELGSVRTPDDALIVKFVVEAIRNNFQSEESQRPVYEDIEYIEIMTAGNQLNIIKRPATNVDKSRFPRHYAAFKRGIEGMMQQGGTPLSQWTILGPSAVRMLNAKNFFTVDQVAGSSDLQLQAVGMDAGMEPQAFREKAKNFLKVAQDTALVDRQAQELAKLRAEMEELRALQAKTPAETITLPKKEAAKA